MRDQWYTDESCCIVAGTFGGCCTVEITWIEYPTTQVFASDKQLAQSPVKEAGTLTTKKYYPQRRSSNQLAPVMGKKQTITQNSQFWHLNNTITYM